MTYCLTKWYLNILQYLLTRVCDLWVYNWMHEVGVILLYLKELHFCGWYCIPHVDPQSASLFKSICRVTQSWWFSIVRYKIQSSANKRVLDETDDDKSLMNTRKSSGTRTNPCGTPLTIGIWLETSPSRTTRCCLLLRKAEIQFQMFPLMP
jgi:hypothetical protein